MLRALCRWCRRRCTDGDGDDGVASTGWHRQSGILLEHRIEDGTIRDEGRLVEEEDGHI